MGNTHVLINWSMELDGRATRGQYITTHQESVEDALEDAKRTSRPECRIVCAHDVSDLYTVPGRAVFEVCNGHDRDPLYSIVTDGCGNVWMTSASGQEYHLMSPDDLDVDADEVLITRFADAALREANNH